MITVLVGTPTARLDFLQAQIAAAANFAAAILATSVSSNTIGLGALTFTTQTGKQFAPGQFVLISSGANYVHGTVTSYIGTSLVINSLNTAGTGAFASWNISISGPQAPAPEPMAITLGTNITGNVTLVFGDANTYRRATNAAPAIVTVPAGVFAVGTQISFRQMAATLTLAAAVGVTINLPFGGSLVLAGVGATASLINVAPDIWDLVGQTEAAP